MTVSTDTIGLNTIVHVFNQQKASIQARRKEPLRQRKERLQKLRTWIHSNRTRIQEGAFNDFRKAPQEVDAIEIFHVLNEIKYTLQQLDQWAAPKKVDAPLTMLGT